MIAFILSMFALLWSLLCSIVAFIMMVLSPLFWLAVIGFFLFGVYLHATEGFINWG